MSPPPPFETTVQQKSRVDPIQERISNGADESQDSCLSLAPFIDKCRMRCETGEKRSESCKCKVMLASIVDPFI